MEGREGKLIKYIEGSKTRFIIPVYQRNYDWKEKNGLGERWLINQHTILFVSICIYKYMQNV